MKEQILALAVQSGFKLDWAILNCTGQFESFYHAAIESYKAELLKEAGEPVGYHYLPNNEMFPVEEVSRSNLKNNPQDYVFLYTSDKVAAAILKVTGLLEKEIERLKTVPMKYRRMAFNSQLQDENNELLTQLAAAQEEIANETAWQPIETAPKETEIFIGRFIDGKFRFGRSELIYEHANEFAGEIWSGWLWSIDDVCESVAECPTHWMPLPKPPAMAQGESGGFEVTPQKLHEPLGVKAKWLK